jgi:hypothetical protein
MILTPTPPPAFIPARQPLPDQRVADAGAADRDDPQFATVAVVVALDAGLRHRAAVDQPVQPPSGAVAQRLFGSAAWLVGFGGVDVGKELPTSADVAMLNPTAQQARTYWLLGANSSEADSCKKLVRNYDYGKANALRSAYGLPTGTLLAVRFPDNKTFYVDVTKANTNQNRELLMSWYQVASTTDATGQTVTSDTIAARMHSAVCNENGMVASAINVIKSAAGVFGFVVDAGAKEFCRTVIV